MLARARGKELLERARRTLAREPAFEALSLDDHGKSLVEVAVAGRIGRLVRQLVEDEGGELGVAVAEHGVQHRVAQVAERRIGDGRTDPGVEAARAQSRRRARCVLLVEVTAIAHAASDRKAPAHRFDRQFRCRKQVPGRVAAAEVGERAVAAVVGQAEIGHREVARAHGELEAAAQRRVGRRVRDHLGNRFASRVHLELSGGDVHVIAAAERDARRRGREGPGRAPRGIA